MNFKRETTNGRNVYAVDYRGARYEIGRRGSASWVLEIDGSYVGRFRTLHEAQAWAKDLADKAEARLREGAVPGAVVRVSPSDMASYDWTVVSRDGEVLNVKCGATLRLVAVSEVVRIVATPTALQELETAVQELHAASQELGTPAVVTEADVTNPGELAKVGDTVLISGVTGAWVVAATGTHRLQIRRGDSSRFIERSMVSEIRTPAQPAEDAAPTEAAPAIHEETVDAELADWEPDLRETVLVDGKSGAWLVTGFIPYTDGTGRAYRLAQGGNEVIRELFELSPAPAGSEAPAVETAPRASSVVMVYGSLGRWTVREVRDNGTALVRNEAGETRTIHREEIRAIHAPELVEYDPADGEGTLTYWGSPISQAEAEKILGQHPEAVVAPRDYSAHLATLSGDEIRAEAKTVQDELAWARSRREASEREVLKAAALGNVEALDPAIALLRDQLAKAAEPQLHTPAEMDAARRTAPAPLPAPDAPGWARLSRDVDEARTAQAAASLAGLREGDQIVDKSLNLWDVIAVSTSGAVTAKHHEDQYHRGFTVSQLAIMVREGEARIVRAKRDENLQTPLSALVATADALAAWGRENGIDVTTRLHGTAGSEGEEEDALEVTLPTGRFTLHATILR